jgi:hypothetical protein
MARGTRLAGEAFSVIRGDWRLLGLPAAALIIDLVVAGAFLGLAAAASRRDLALWIAFAAASYPMTLSSTFFNVALMHVVSQRWRGNPATVADGLRVARQRIPTILAWSAIAASVGLALQVLQRVGHFAAIERLLASLAGLSWGVATFFVVPALALQDIGPLAAIKRSSATVRRRWAESLTGYVAIGGAAVFLAIPGAILCAVGYFRFSGHPQSAVFLILIGAALVLPVVLYMNATGAVFSLAVLEYADGAAIVGPFSPEDLQSPFIGGQRIAKARGWVGSRLGRKQHSA